MNFSETTSKMKENTFGLLHWMFSTLVVILHRGFLKFVSAGKENFAKK